MSIFELITRTVLTLILIVITERLQFPYCILFDAVILLWLVIFNWTCVCSWNALVGWPLKLPTGNQATSEGNLGIYWQLRRNNQLTHTCQVRRDRQQVQLHHPPCRHFRASPDLVLQKTRRSALTCSTRHPGFLMRSAPAGETCVGYSCRERPMKCTRTVYWMSCPFALAPSRVSVRALEVFWLETAWPRHAQRHVAPHTIRAVRIRSWEANGWGESCAPQAHKQLFTASRESQSCPFPLARIASTKVRERSPGDRRCRWWLMTPSSTAAFASTPVEVQPDSYRSPNSLHVLCNTPTALRSTTKKKDKIYYTELHKPIGVGCTWHTLARAQMKFLKVVEFFNRFNSVASLSNKVNKISNMTLWFLHTLKEPWLINITLQIIFNMIIKKLH